MYSQNWHNWNTTTNTTNMKYHYHMKLNNYEGKSREFSCSSLRLLTGIIKTWFHRSLLGMKPHSLPMTLVWRIELWIKNTIFEMFHQNTFGSYIWLYLNKLITTGCSEHMCVSYSTKGSWTSCHSIRRLSEVIPYHNKGVVRSMEFPEELLIQIKKVKTYFKPWNTNRI